MKPDLKAIRRRAFDPDTLDLCDYAEQLEREVESTRATGFEREARAIVETWHRARAATLEEVAQHLEGPAAATLKRVTDRAMFVLAAHVVRDLALPASTRSADASKERGKVDTSVSKPVSMLGAPVCARCSDTHIMEIHHEGTVRGKAMCTFCPVPCQKCRVGGNGPFCEKTPCACACHVKPSAPACATCGDERYVETAPAGPGLLAEHQWCPDCGGPNGTKGGRR